MTIDILQVAGLTGTFTVDPQYSELQANRAKVNIPVVVSDNQAIKRLRGITTTLRLHLKRFWDRVERARSNDDLTDKGKSKLIAEARQEYEATVAKVSAIVYQELPTALQDAYPDPGPYQRTADETALLAALLPTLEGAPWYSILNEISQLITDGQYWAARKALEPRLRQLIQPTDPQWESDEAKQGLRDCVEYFNMASDTPQHQAAAAATDLLEGLQGQYRALMSTVANSVEQIEAAVSNGGVRRELQSTIESNFGLAAQLAPDLTEDTEGNE